MKHYDLVIVGSGMVGAGLAAALRDTSLRVALIDARLPDNNDPRLFALNSGSCHFLQHLDIWPALSTYAAPIHQVHVSQRGRFGSVRLCRDDVALPTLGHVVPAKHIEAALNETLMTLPNVTLYRPATLVTLQQDDNATLKITTPDGEQCLQASLVIGADGTTSTVREQAGIQAETVDYGQSAIVTRTTLRRSHQAIAYERFTQDGAIAMLPLSDNECATIWSTSHDHAKNLMALSDQDFLQHLQKEFGYRLGRLQQIAKRHCFPLQMVRAKQMIAGRVLLLGNAAHTVHPVAAQGFNLALYEVAVLVESIREQWQAGVGLTADVLAQVSERAQKQQTMSIGVSHRLAQLFATSSAGMSLLTQFGMAGLDATRPLKKKLMEGMLGRTGNVPRLLLDVNG